MGAMAFALYFLGSIVLVSGLAGIASALGAAPTLVTACAAILLALSATAGMMALARADR